MEDARNWHKSGLLATTMHRSHSLTVAKQNGSMESQPYTDSYLILEKYNRLLESHHRLLRVNQNLEDKLLKVVTLCEEQKAAMRTELEDMQERLQIAEAKAERLQNENIKYRRDCLLAVQLLQCNPNGFVDHEVRNLPRYVQAKLAPSQGQANGFGDYDTDSDDGSHRPSYNVPELEIYPLPFPPSAVMVPTVRRDRSSPNPFATLHSGPENASMESLNGSRKVSAETIANVIREDLERLSPLTGDIRSRQTAASKIGESEDGPGRIQHV